MAKVTTEERQSVYTYIKANRQELEAYIREHAPASYGTVEPVTTEDIIYWLIFNEELNMKAISKGVSIVTF